ncbi:hypothetical protein M408DRAFT_232328 [Serendipita vermifera MAFF 305830]|uniref:Uncharacterized protein n=1 Tax=Serendipita vermifera MAFF 305830 TaxID=933852 RepID=A0A0C2WDF0_SERVB|nr:hypothetical protein M408DRAFT_232328 [Serendipita vermifera MAFF 305830]
MRRREGLDLNVGNPKSIGHGEDGIRVKGLGIKFPWISGLRKVLQDSRDAQSTACPPLSTWSRDRRTRRCDCLLNHKCWLQAFRWARGICDARRKGDHAHSLVCFPIVRCLVHLDDYGDLRWLQGPGWDGSWAQVDRKILWRLKVPSTPGEAEVG